MARNVVRSDLATKNSTVDDAWDMLTDEEKIHMMESHTKEFNLTKSKLKELLFTLQITEQEINTAFAVNNGGAVIYMNEDKQPTARIDKFLDNGTAKITIITLTSSKDVYELRAQVKIVSIEDYEVAPFSPIDTDMLTKYTIFAARAAELGYSENIARERLVEYFQTLTAHNFYNISELKHVTHWLDVYANSVAICDHEPEIVDDTNKLLVLSRRMSARTGADDMYDNIAAALIKLTGVNVKTGVLHVVM